MLKFTERDQLIKDTGDTNGGGWGYKRTGELYMQLFYIYVPHGCPVQCADCLIRGACICGHIIQHTSRLLERHVVEAPPRAHHTLLSSASSAAMAAKWVTEGISLSVFVMVDSVLGSGFGVASGLDVPMVSP